MSKNQISKLNLKVFNLMSNPAKMFIGHSQDAKLEVLEVVKIS